MEIIPVNNQLDAQFFFRICLFQFSTCFEQPCAHHQESQLYQYNIWYVSLWPSDTQVWPFRPNLHTRRSPTYSDIYQISYWYNWLLMMSTWLLETCRELK